MTKHAHNAQASALHAALAAAPAARVAWNKLTTIAQRDFLTWIGSAKQEETRKGRIKKACSMLVAGKRRPCCYAVVPLYFYSALAASPKAKAAWSTMTPDARRDVVAWVESGKDSQDKKTRATQACKKLAALLFPV